METKLVKSELESAFGEFRNNILGTDAAFSTPYGRKRLVYADWIASGRMYQPIEEKMLKAFGPYVANTHSEASFTGKTMTRAYHHAHDIIKAHVNAGKDDVILTVGTGMTRAVSKLQRILGFRIPEQFQKNIQIPETDKPVVFITHMEHHSNQTPWLETIADVVIIPPADDLTIDLRRVEETVAKYAQRKIKIGTFTACSNVTGVRTPYHQMAKIMHRHGGLCFIDFAASAPYDTIDMHPEDPEEALDAIFFSPHKFLGGPGSSGVLIFNRKMYRNRVPDQPGGGTVKWTNPWGKHSYFEDIELREDGGTPGFLQAIRAALCVKLKEEMGPDRMARREHELLHIAFRELRTVPGLRILADHVEKRLGVISFYVDGIHYNLLVALLNDMFGIQVRGGCSCAGTYGHMLLNVDEEKSNSITEKIDSGDLTEKPGWVRLSLHPTMTNDELYFILDAINKIARNIDQLKTDYNFDPHKGEFTHISDIAFDLSDWFTFNTNNQAL